jgi:HK97 family phage major capsid protein
MKMDRDEDIAEALGELESKALGRIDAVEKKLGDMATKFDSALGDFEKSLLYGGTRNDGGLPKANPEQKAALEGAVRALLRGDQRKADELFGVAQTKAGLANSDPDGGFFVLPQFGAELNKIIADISPVAQLARTVNIDAGMSYEEIIDSNQAAAQWAGETDARGDTATPALNKFRVELAEIFAQPKATQSLIDASSYDVVAWLQGKIAEAFAITESAAFHSGTGVAQPRGFLTLPTSTASDKTRPLGTVQIVNTGASGAFPAASSTVNSADPLQDLIAALRVQYRSNAAWLMNRQTAGVCSKLKDATTGRWLWQDSLVQGQPATLLGYPVYLSEDMPDIAPNSLSIAFGDWRKFYCVLRRTGIRMLTDPYTDKPFVKLYAYSRVGGGVANSQAVKLLKFA